MQNWMPDHVTGVLAFVVIPEGQLRIQSTHLFIHFWSQEEGKEVVLEKLLLDHVVKHRSDTSLSKVRVRQSNDGIEILPENAVFLLNIAEFLVLN